MSANDYRHSGLFRIILDILWQNYECLVLSNLLRLLWPIFWGKIANANSFIILHLWESSWTLYGMALVHSNHPFMLHRWRVKSILIRTNYSKESCFDEFGKIWSNKMRIKKIDIIFINFLLSSKACTKFIFCLLFLDKSKAVVLMSFAKVYQIGTQQKSANSYLASSRFRFLNNWASKLNLSFLLEL